MPAYTLPSVGGGAVDIDQTKVRVLNTLIGHIGDTLTLYVTVQKLCVKLRRNFVTLASIDISANADAAAVEQLVSDMESTYDELVQCCCRMLSLQSGDVEDLAKDTRFDALEGDAA